MFRSIEGLRNSVIHATDGEIGSVENFLFDDEKWTVRYLVVKAGSWLTGKKVLVTPKFIKEVDTPAHSIRVSLTRDQVKKSPDIDTDKPVSRQMELQYHNYYMSSYYWDSPAAWKDAAYRAPLLGQPYLVPSPAFLHSPGTSVRDDGDNHLRSTGAVHGYGVEASDHDFGSVEDFIINDESWAIRYLVINTIRFWPCKSVLIAPEWVESVNWTHRKIMVELTEDKIKNAPTYFPDHPVDREYEERLYDYYGHSKSSDRKLFGGRRAGG